MIKNRAGASLLLLDFTCDPCVITEALDLLPTKSYKVGDVGPTASMIRKMNGWDLASRLPRDRDIEEHVDDLVAQLSPAKEKLLQLQFGGTRTIACHLYVEGEQIPAIHMSAPSMKFIGDIGAEFDLDMYHFSSPEPDVANQAGDEE